MTSLAQKRAQLEELLRGAERARAGGEGDAGRQARPARRSGPTLQRSEDVDAVAIVGLAGRYPGAETLDEFWANLLGGRSGIEEMQGPRLADYLGGGEPGARTAAERVRHFGLLRDIYRFDAPFFGISRREAEVMDPHMRLLLEAAWSCVENAGYRPRALGGRTGVFVSFYNHEYAEMLRDLEIEAASEAYLGTATTGAIFANRISFLLGLTGPSEVYNTACSTALVALHRCVQSIRAGECDQAIVAGASLLLTPSRVLALGKMGILNETGRCNPYSHPANKETIGEGVGALLVKPLARAVADGDYVYAVVRGSDVSHHGNRSGGMTLPSADALAELMATTYRRLGAGATDRLRYIEGHGAGGATDVIELRAIESFLATVVPAGRKVPVGSVKSNIGFGEASGGMAQLTKCLLALQAGEVPATLNFERTDPVFDYEAARLRIATENVTLAGGAAGAGGGRGMEEACVSVLAYGLGGTNAHVVLGGHAAAVERSQPAQRVFPLVFSAGTEAELADYVRRVAMHLASGATARRYREIFPSESQLLHAVARTLIGRERQQRVRVVFLVASVADWLAAAAAFSGGQVDARIVRAAGEADATGNNGDAMRELAARWVAGEAVAEETWLGGAGYRKLPLPTVGFCGEEYRLARKVAVGAAAPVPVLATRTGDGLEARWRVEGRDERLAAEIVLGTEDCLIAQHRVDGQPVLPGVAYVTLLGALVRKMYRREHYTIEDLAWTMPLVLERGTATVRYEAQRGGRFRVLHKERGVVCCTGRLVVEAEREAAAAAARVRSVELEGAAVVAERSAYWRAANAPETRQWHGPELRRLEGIYRVGDVLVGAMESFEGAGGEARGRNEIGILDSALGVCRGFGMAEAAATEAVVPFAVERIRVLRPIPSGRRLYAAAERRSGKLVRYDLSVEDGAGTVFVVLTGYFAKAFTSLAKPAVAQRTAAVASVVADKAGGGLRDVLLAELRAAFAGFLKCELETVPTDGRLDHLGLDSIGLNALTEQLRGGLGIELPATTLFEYGSLREVAEFLVSEFGEALGASRGERVAAVRTESPAVVARERETEERTTGADDVAVVGMGGLFPGAGDVHAFWRRICAGDDLIAELPEARRRSVYEVYRESLRELKMVQGGFVEEADRFDAGFFGLSEPEVMAMDPQQRLFLEAAWASIEDAGYHPPALSGQRVGVYVGAIVNEYGTYLGDVGYPVSMFHEGTGGSLAGIANRVSYVLNLTGPSQAIDAACCSSLYALDRAVADLRSGTCDAALAGGVSFIGCAAGYQMYSAMKYLAKDWRCKAFAAGGDGWAKAEVFASVFLKRHADAVRDGDPIYGVIKATGTNHGGRGYFYTQPNSPRHVELVRDVLRKADVAPESLVHIEAHGSGTEMGDVLEFNSLARALKEYAAERGVTLPANGCGIGSIKSNLGHAEAGSGILGFIKSVLLLHSGRIPRTLHVETTSANLREAGSPLALMREGRVLRPREGAGPARCASVHSFNFSGATAHALVAEHVGTAAGGTLGLTRFPICLSAKTSEALAAYRGKLARFLREEAGAAVSLDRLAFTLACSRSQFAQRWGVVVGSREELMARLEAGAGVENGCFAGVASKRASGAPAAEGLRLADQQVDELMRRWVEDAAFDWTEVLRGFAVQKINLPTYPFDHSVSYFPQVEAGAAPQRKRAVLEAVAVKAATVAQPVSKAAEAGRKLPAASEPVEAQVVELFARVLELAPEEIDLARAVSDFGFDSAKVVALATALSERFGLEIKPPDLFEFAKPAEIVAFIGRARPVGSAGESKQTTTQPTAGREGIAVIGMSGQLPGAADLEEFWENLVAGKDAIAEIPAERWDWRKFAGDARREANKTDVRWGGFISEVTTFDPLFFGISPREAEWMDPQQRLLLMYAWRALEDAGYAPSSLAGSDTGVFVATGSSAYGTRAPGTAEGFSATGAIPSIGPNRLSHFLDLRGPSEPVETSCSSGLVAVHRAVRALQAGECGMAIVGGINTLVTPDEHLSFSKAGMLAKDGRCKTFSDQADGYGRGEGVGFVVLKPLAAAEREGDRILAVIRGSAVNHGGRANSLTAPSPRAQAEVLTTAWRAAGIDPRTVGYIETHGTGTTLGDPIEINGLKAAWRELHAGAGVAMAGEPQCALGAVKTNIGHLELAAGIAGMLKVLLQLRHRTLVKSLHCARVNPYVELRGTPFYLLKENREWVAPRDEIGRALPRRAGVSSFGFGGVNAHVVLEEYCAAVEREAGVDEEGKAQLVVLSAKNEARLREAAGNLERYLERHSEVRLADVAYTLQVGRDAMSERLAVMADSTQALRASLARYAATGDVGSDGWSGRAAKAGLAREAVAPGADWTELGRRWVTGATVEWAGFWAKGAARRISLPTYPFAKDRCWLEATTVAERQRGAEDRGEDVMYLPRWERAELPAEGRGGLRPPRRWVVVHTGASALGAALAKRCGVRWPGAEGGVMTPDDFSHAQSGTAIDVVFFVSGAEALEEVNPHAQELALLRMAQAIRQRATGEDPVEFFVVTTDKFPVDGGRVLAAGGGVTGLAYAVAQAEHRFRVRNVDVASREVEAGAAGVAERILGEPASDRGEVVRLEAGGRYRRVLLPLEASGVEASGAFRRGGRYVILGGAGRVGEAVTRFLMETHEAHVVWIGRRAAESAEVQAKLRAVRAAGAAGSVEYVAADACDVESLRAAIGRIRREQGTIDGAIFAASVFSFANGFAETTEREFLDILEVKTRGSVNFRAALEGERLDFLVYFSSAQSFAFSGAATLSAYAAGITFTDALVEAWQARAPFPIGSIDWGFWESGEAEGAEAKATAGALDARTGCACLERFAALLRAGVMHRVVSMRISDTVRPLVPLSGERVTVAAQVAVPVTRQTIEGAAEGRMAPTVPAAAVELERWIVRLLAARVGAAAPRRELRGALEKWWRQTQRLLTEHAEWVPPRETEELWAHWDEWRRTVAADAPMAAQIELVDACLRALPEILAGRARATDVLFPGASMERVERVYRDNGAFDHFNAVVAEVVRAAVERAGAPVRVLEIGAGTGGTTAAVLERLRGAEGKIASYVYTDVSRAFLAHGERRFGTGRGFMEFRVLDIEVADGWREAEVGSFDVVIAANVLHATRDIARTLRNAKAALKRNGLLVLNEIAGPSLFAHVTFGLLEGWWLFEDAARRIPGSPGLYPDGWDAVLREEGFGAVSFPARAAHGLGQQVVVAVSDGVIRRARVGTGGRAQVAARAVEASTVKVAPTRGVAGESEEGLERVIRRVLSSLLKIPEAQFEREQPFSDYGVDSILGVSFVTRLGDELGLALNAAILFEYATIERLAGYLRTRGAGRAGAAVSQSVGGTTAAMERAPVVADAGEIAVIGMAGQFPGALDVGAFWKNLLAGRSVIGELPAEYGPAGEGYRWGGVLEERACFDPLFFNVSPREAESMTPHQRLILQESWKALEDAGINPRTLAGKAVGLFIGAEPSGYEYETFTGASDAIVASRLSYFLNLKGPALVVNTGCSSSAAAIHLACESLRTGGAEVALAGGVFATMDQAMLAPLAGMGMLSASGCCRPFDAAADGTVFSEGVGVVVLKRLREALADGDPIHGVIVASAMNQDGASNGLTAPNGEAQEALVAGLYRRCGIEAERIGYVETHGTGTRLGDPVEANALVRAFRQFTTRERFCALGSVKGAIGHASAASGVISLIKVLLMLRHGRIPAQGNFSTLNPLIELGGSAFFVNEREAAWTTEGGKLRMAALNSFGHSGTNVHLVVRAAPEEPVAAGSGSGEAGPQLIVLSAKDEARLRERAQRLAEWLESEPACDLAAVAHTLQVGREPMKERLAVVANDAAELRARLGAWLGGNGNGDTCRGTVDGAGGMARLLAGAEEMRGIVARWIEGGEWGKVAEFWCLGGAVDWAAVKRGGPGRRVRLPAYPFAKERYWKPARRVGQALRAEAGNGTGAAAAMSETAHDGEVVWFEEVWEPRGVLAAGEAVAKQLTGVVACLLADAGRRESVRAEMARIAPRATVVFAKDVAALREMGAIEAVVDFRAVEDRAVLQEPAAAIALVQALRAAGVKPRRVVLAAGFANGVERSLAEAWVGLERSLPAVWPEVKVSVVLGEEAAGAPEMATWAARAGEALSGEAATVLYRGGVALELRRRGREIVRGAEMCFAGKTILVTGGLGGLGRVIARWLAEKGAAQLVLVGRSQAEGRVEEVRRTLRGTRATVHYVVADVANATELGAGLASVRAEVGPIHGVVHAAGVKDERTVFEKPLDAARAVLAAKVAGTLALDAVLAEEPLEFVVYFASVAAALGDFGACDYAVGNRFQLAYAEQRNALVAAGQRRGRTVAIGWGAWAGAGMGGEAEAALHLKVNGQRPLRAEEGLTALEGLLRGEGGRAAFVVAGEPERVRRTLGLGLVEGVAGLQRELRGTLGRLLKLAPERIGEEQNFADFGLDSVSLVELARVLSGAYAVELTPSVFFGYSTVKALAQHLWEGHGVRPRGVGTQARRVASPEVKVAGARVRDEVPEPMAIVGMSGRFAGARSVDEMWALLREGRCAVGELPAERFGGAKAEGCWCGVVPGVGEFDPGFFEISPLEAESMDPRQRLLLQEGWNALEDAGMGAAELARMRVGMFVGAEDGDYQQRVTEGSITSNHGGVLASRLAYFLDLKGPVLAINTSCSSSLVALHQACLSLRAGECDAALVAGVNLITARETLAAMAEAGMLSADGKCRTFDAEANGMVPGEAIAVVVLKRLERAVAEGDAVHAVIAGSGVNYDGKTNGITAPNGVAQAALLRAVYRQSGVDPAAVDLVVTHGTGTRLGDPVEVNALREVFAEAGAGRTEPCGLVSCKPNLGHAFAASGLVSVIALVQALRHATLPGSVNFARRNQFIRWEGAPFVVRTESAEWLARDGRERLGAVSAFGMSGTNAHVIVREAPEELARTAAEEGGAEATGRVGKVGAWYLLAWSAQTDEALLARTRGLVAYLKSGDVTDAEMAALSCTLLLGRHHLRRRRAAVVRTIAEAVAALDRAAVELERKMELEPKVEGDASRGEEREVTALLVEAMAARGDEARERETWERVAAAFCAGGRADWSVLFGGKRLRPLRLPTYPFARRNFWLPVRGNEAAGKSDALSGFRARAWMPDFAAEAALVGAGSPDTVMEERAAAVLAAMLRERPDGASPTGYLARWIEESRRLLAESDIAEGSLAEAWAEWERAAAGWRGKEALAARGALLEAALRGLPEILAGRRKATDVLFPESSVELVERVYRHDRVAALFNEAMANAVEAWVEARLAEEPGQTLRLIEVGAGTGGTTAAVLPRLKRFGARIAEYAYTDLSKAFLLHADERFVPEYPCVVPRLFDVSRPAAAQGVELGRYDLAIGANVLHATADIRAAVRHVKSVLRPGGGLMLGEVSANGWFTHLTFGLLEGWWLYRDAELRLRGCPGLSPAMWARVLNEEGFGPVAFPAEAGHALGQQLIVAVSDGRGVEVGGTGGTPVRREDDEGSGRNTGGTPVPLGSALSNADGGQRRCVEYFRGLLSRTLKMEPREIDPQQPLEAYGVDSLTIGKVLARLREVFSDVPSTLLFETRTVAALADHFWQTRRADVVAVIGEAPVSAGGVVTKQTTGVARVSGVSGNEIRGGATAREPIAIVGLSGRYPAAPDLRTFWENLRAGRDCIGEVPAERWGLDGFFEAEVERAIEEGKSYCKWGGFLERFSEFDPLFFKIAPREALHMDPQERLFVQAAWEVLEDAGYTPKSLVERTGGRVGVFTGITHTDYNIFGPGQWRRGEKIYPRTSFSSVPNRVSFLLNLSGPSVPVDTMCSSSLTALHEACEAILRGDCAMAIAGAVNLCLHPSSYVALCAARMLSRRGECHSFGVGEDGYIPGEGVGAVLLKRLSEAQRDGDQIHAVIRGTAVNHGGRTNGYTVPDPQSQGQVVREALERAGVNARTISYVEAHGTGTKLGDPIEVAGLTRAFRGDTSEVGFCALGSVKSNVGHLEAAAGLVGLTKVILAMKHGELPPSLHAEELNPEIDFGRTPFVVQRALGCWERPTVNVDGKEETVPRRAGVSSFGAGGANAHVVVEEYVEAREMRPVSAGVVAKEAEEAAGAEPCVIVLSARDGERLKDGARRLVEFLEHTPETELADVAYTLQVGREAMEERLGFVARSLVEVARVLRAFLAEGRAEGLQRGRAEGAGAGGAEFLEKEEMEELVTTLIARRKLERLVGLWVRGGAVDWNRIHGEARPRRISLPTYPFAPERYWFSDTADAIGGVEREEIKAGGKTWAFLREAWEERAMPENVDWQARWQRQAGRRVAVVSANRVEAEALAGLLRQLAAAAALARPLRVEVRGENDAFDGEEAPEVVLCLGGCGGDARDVEIVFGVSQRLMNAGWGEPVEVFYLEEAGRPESEALAGFVRAAMKENEQHAWTLVWHDAGWSREARLQLLVREWLCAERRDEGSFAGVEVRHVGERREVKTLAETTLPVATATKVFRERGVYLLAGGLGYLGQQLSVELAKRYRATLVLLTRGALDEEKRAHCRRLEELGATVVVESVDIADRAALEQAYRRVRERVGAVHGVFHLARQHDDRMIARKTWASFANVVRTKVDGTRWLDELTRDEPLDFFAVFSSLGAYGVRGASDYSYATAFQNAFSRERARLVREGQRRGASVALCWGPWEEDRLFPQSRGKLVEAGFALIGIAEGFAVMERALVAGETPLTLVALREAGKVRRVLGLEAETGEAPPRRRSELDDILETWEARGERGELAVEMSARLGEAEILAMSEGQVNRVYQLLFGANGANGTNGASERKEARAAEGGAEALAGLLRIVFTQVLQLRAIDDGRAFQDYGMDSISGMQAAVRLEKALKREVPPQWLINYPTIAALSRHLAAENFDVPKTE